jgi:hypothetical protein
VIDPAEEFISEPIVPATGSADTSAMSRGEPGLPHEFTWRGKSYTVAHRLETWKTSTPDRGELYLRRHWFRIVTVTGERMTLYCERQAKNAKKPKARWWIYSISNH